MNEIWTSDIYEILNDKNVQRDEYESYVDSYNSEISFDEFISDIYYNSDSTYEGWWESICDSFDMDIMPMIENSPSIKDFPTMKQWGCVPPLFLIGSRSGWKAGSGGIVWESIEDMRKWILYPDYDSTTTIYNDDGEMYISQSDHDGNTSGTLCTFTSDESALLTCLWKDTIYPDDLEYFRDKYQDGLTDDELILEAFYDDICSSEYIDWSGFIGAGCLVPVKI